MESMRFITPILTNKDGSSYLNFENNTLKLGTLYIDEYGIARLYNPETNEDTNIIDSINATDTTLSNWTAVDGKSMNGEKVYGNSIGWSQLSSDCVFKYLGSNGSSSWGAGWWYLTLSDYNAVLITFGSGSTDGNNVSQPTTAICAVGSSGSVFGRMYHGKLFGSNHPIGYRTFSVNTNGVYFNDPAWHGFGLGKTWQTTDETRKGFVPRKIYGIKFGNS
jgi:hypothetical protein